MVGETGSVIALAVAFGFAFLGVLQWASYMIKENDKERQTLRKEADNQRVLAVDTQNTLNEKKLELHDLKLKYNRLASAAKRLKDENDVLRRLTTPDNGLMNESDITQVEMNIGVELAVAKDIEDAE